jgi:hypothetical protein
VHSLASRDIESDRNPTDVNGVRVHHLRTPTILLLRREEVRDAGLEDESAIVNGDQYTMNANTSAESKESVRKLM